METPDPKVYPTILGGVLRGFWSPLLDLGAGSAIFWHLKTGTFGKIARFQVPKNVTSDAETNKNGDHFIMPACPKNGELHVCSVHLSQLEGFKNNLDFC